MTDHTPEPWETYNNHLSINNGMRHVCHCEYVEDAARIVACVNACTGISTERLGDVKALVEAVKRLEPHVDAIICYASSMGDHEPNQLAHDLRAALASFERTEP